MALSRENLFFCVIQVIYVGGISGTVPGIGLCYTASDPRLLHTVSGSRCIMMRWCYDEFMRTTITLPEDLYRTALSIAHDSSSSLSETVALLLRKALGQGTAAAVGTDPETGFPVVRLGRVITTEDVRSLEDD